MDEIANVGSEKSSAIEQILETSRKQTGAMSDVVASSTSLNELSHELRSVLEPFRTRPEAAAEEQK